MYQSIDTSRPVARKKYLCFWCVEDILPGEKYLREVGTFEGEFQSLAYHLECEKASEKWGSQNPGEPYGEGEFKRGSTDPRRGER